MFIISAWEEKRTMWISWTSGNEMGWGSELAEVVAVSQNLTGSGFCADESKDEMLHTAGSYPQAEVWRKCI